MHSPIFILLLYSFSGIHLDKRGLSRILVFLGLAISLNVSLDHGHLRGELLVTLFNFGLLLFVVRHVGHLGDVDCRHQGNDTEGNEDGETHLIHENLEEGHHATEDKRADVGDSEEEEEELEGDLSGHIDK